MSDAARYDTYALDLAQRLQQTSAHLHALVWRHADVEQGGKLLGLAPDAPPPLVIVIRSQDLQTRFLIEVERSAWPHDTREMVDLTSWITVTANLALQALDEGKPVAPIIHVQKPTFGPSTPEAP
jgi:hypothetical protein